MLLLGEESFLYRAVPSWPLGVGWLLSDAGQVWAGGTHLWGRGWEESSLYTALRKVLSSGAWLAAFPATHMSQ